MNELCPAQQEPYNFLVQQMPHHSLFRFWGESGSGRTTVLKKLCAHFHGAYIGRRERVEAMFGQHPLSLEENLWNVLRKALREHEYVFVDDLDDFDVFRHCPGYPRGNYIESVLDDVAAEAKALGRKLLICDGPPSRSFRQESRSHGIDDFTPDDYAFLVRAYLGDGASELNFARIHRFAPKLNAYQLAMAARWYDGKSVDTEAFIDYLRSQNLTSNVNLGEVQPVQLSDLKGIDAVIESLVANIVVPMENDALAAQYGLKPRRGVLLAGPPGTGKTTVGRALAHRLKSKFFLIDGTVIVGTSQFYSHIHHVFEEAKANAPSIIFIDDSDVIFDDQEESMGLYRYLLTMLDGLESASNAQVCVMMTAMDVSSLPPALIRSGRIELWLTMPLPDESARCDILRQKIDKLPEQLRSVDVAGLAQKTTGFTGADLKRLVEDAKTLAAYDQACGRPAQAVDAYFQRAVQGVQSNKATYAQAERRARERWYDVPSDD